MSAVVNAFTDSLLAGADVPTPMLPVVLSTAKMTVALACWIWKALVQLAAFLNVPAPLTVIAEAVSPPLAVRLDVVAPSEVWVSSKSAVCEATAWMMMPLLASAPVEMAS